MSLIRFAIVALLAAALGWPAAACTQESVQAKKARHKARAAGYFEAGQYQEALIEFKNVVQLDPNDADGHYRLALTYLKLGGVPNLQDAFSELNKAVGLDAANHDAQLKLGQLYLLGNEPEKARERAEAVLASTPQSSEGLVLKGQSLINEKKFKEGIAELRRAMELDPKNIRIYLELAGAYVRTNDLAQAEATLKQALSIDAQSIETLVALGDFHLLNKQPEEAERHYQRALQIAPGNDALYVKLAGFYQVMNKWDQAETTLNKLVELKPKDDKPRILLGDLHKGRGEPSKALASYQQALEVNSASTTARDKLIAQLLDMGKLEEAEARIKSLTEKNSKDLSGRFFSARVHLAKGHPEAAIPLLREVIKEEPRAAAAHQFLGLALAQQGEVGQAISELNEAIKLSPSSADARTALAALYLQQGSPDQAIVEGLTALRLNPRDGRAATVLGDAYLQKGDLAKAKQVFEAIAKALPANPLGPHRLGLIARAQKQDGEAVAHFEQALKLDPHFVDALAQIAAMRLAVGKPDEARERVMRQLQAAPNDPSIYNLLGRLWMASKNNDQAEAAFKKAIELNPALLASYMNLGELYQRTGKLDQAIGEYESALARQPKLVPAMMMLGIIYDQRNDIDLAKSWYEKALQADPLFAPAANNLAWILIEHGGNSDVALAHAQTARERRPEDPYIADTLGWIYFKKQIYLKAANLLKEAVEKLSDHPVVLYHYGMLHYKNGNKAEAKKFLERSLKLSSAYPGSDQARKALAEL